MYWKLNVLSDDYGSDKSMLCIGKWELSFLAWQLPRRCWHGPYFKVSMNVKQWLLSLTRFWPHLLLCKLRFILIVEDLEEVPQQTIAVFVCTSQKWQGKKRRPRDLRLLTTPSRINTSNSLRFRISYSNQSFHKHVLVLFLVSLVCISRHFLKTFWEFFLGDK